MAQYIKFEMPVLQSFITKLKEEEDREVLKLTRRYHKHFLEIIKFSNFYNMLDKNNLPTRVSNPVRVERH